MTTTLILGPPGTGKTTRLLNLVDEALHAGTAPNRIGFVSFTRKAVQEARQRAAERFDLHADELVYYRTLHSLAFRQLGLNRADVLQFNHLKEIGDQLGVKVTRRRPDESGALSHGDQMVALETLARLKCVDYMDAWETVDNDLEWFAFDQFCRFLRKYKDGHYLVDFTDMLQQFHSRGHVPELDLLVVDEAQDLSQLQWRVVERLQSSSAVTYIAGDDDQAIFRWSGADVDHFLNLDVDDRQVLDRSFRVPEEVHKLAVDLSARIGQRYNKVFHSTGKAGSVEYAASVEDVPGLDTGEWLVLVRNNYMVKEVTEYLRTCGFAYEAEWDKPADNEALHAAYAWEALRAGRTISNKEARNLVLHVDWKLERNSSVFGDTVDRAAFERGSGGISVSCPWYEALTKIGVEEREYFRAARRRGENLRHPRIKVSTIHGAKGGECDNVLLFTDISNRTARGMYSNPDDETRVFYVGATRALTRLCIVQPQTSTYFSI